MKVVKAFPPNYRAINDAFNVRGKNVIFCYGDRIYNPAGIMVGQDLVAHESVHSERQKAYAGGVESWWQHYIADPAFRLAEEIPAHQAEFQYWTRQPGADRPVKGFRSGAEFHRLQIAQRLAGTLYGRLLRLSEAMVAVGCVTPRI
jgi:hypothetical protein